MTLNTSSFTAKDAHQSRIKSNFPRNTLMENLEGTKKYWT